MTSYEKLVIDAITSDSESEIADEDVNHILNEDIRDDNEDQSSTEEDPEDEQ